MTDPKTLRLVDRALDALVDDRLEDAEAALARAGEAAADLPERWMAEGEIASRRGDPEAAIAAFERAVALAPEWVSPRVELATEVLFGRDTPEAALAIAEDALAAGPGDAYDRARALFVVAAAADALERDADARAALAELRALAVEDAELWREIGHLHANLGDAADAADAYRAALRLDPRSADAWYGLGCALLEAGDREGGIDAWQRTRALDIEGPRPPWRLSDDELEAIAERTLRELPPMVRARLADVPILVEDAPSEALVADGVDPRLLGLFTGTPLPHKESVGGAPVAPDAAQLFLGNLERFCADREELEAQVRITILHETAHYFGLEDEDLDAIGLG